MTSSIDIWRILAGVAIFLLGMNFLEDGLHALAGRPFKLFLKRNTANKLKALSGGAVVTAVLQSSSIVNFMVLALAGTGIIQLQNALAIMLGANLGTTFTSWVIATAGFSFNIEGIALPLTGISGIVLLFLRSENNWKHWMKFTFGFGFLFVGLDYIKTGIEHAVLQMDLRMLNEQPAVLFLLIGIIITSLIQSSAATVAIVLSALHVNAISLFSATAIVLGAEVGTTIKLVLASVNGQAAKKRVAYGNLLFNSASSLVILLCLLPVNKFITNTLNIVNPIVALVFFQTLVNVAGIVIFFPFLNMFSKFLQRRFAGNNDASVFMSELVSKDPELALQALEKENLRFIYHVVDFITGALDLSSSMQDYELSKSAHHKTAMEKYGYIKHLYGEMHAFYIKVQRAQSSGIDVVRLEQLISSVRNWMYAAKNIRDALLDIDQLRRSSNDTKYNFYLLNRQKMEQFTGEINRIIFSDKEDKKFESIKRLHQLVQKGYTDSLGELYKDGIGERLNESEISTLINFNREMYTAFKSMIFALKDYVLDSKEAALFDNLPGFIR